MEHVKGVQVLAKQDTFQHLLTFMNRNGSGFAYAFQGLQQSKVAGVLQND